jgi:hypothetical protein
MTLKTQIMSDIDSAFLNTDEFADEAIWIKVTSEGPPVVCELKTISGIFDEAFNAVDINGQAIEGSVPTFLASSAAVDGIADGDTITIDGQVWNVIGRQPDGTGMTLLILSEDEA